MYMIVYKLDTKEHNVNGSYCNAYNKNKTKNNFFFIIIPQSALFVCLANGNSLCTEHIAERRGEINYVVIE